MKKTYYLCLKNTVIFFNFTLKVATLVILAFILNACVTSTPKQVENICSIFQQKRGWYKQAKRSESKWGSSIPTMMAIMRQESSFRAKAKPARTKLLWFIPWSRPSNAYGYPQALNSTWSWYKKNTGNRGADRDDFGDAIDFIGWYNAQTVKANSVKKDNVYHLYLAYHEGHGGYKRKTYQNKTWLKQVAQRVEVNATNYKKQLNRCEKQLNKGFSLWPF